MSEESQSINPAAAQEAAEEILNAVKGGKGEKAATESDEDGDEAREETLAAAGSAAPAKQKKKKSNNKKKLKDALMEKPSSTSKEEQATKLYKAIDGFTSDQISQPLDLNRTFANELSSSSDPNSAAEAFKRHHLQDIMTGLASSGKNVKDMASYKFWSTQPVPKFGEEGTQIEEGPLKNQKIEDVPKEPAQLLPGFEWCTMDLLKEENLTELCELLDRHYVEDDEAMFRFKYSKSTLRWALMSPGWKQEWHVGIRASQARKLVAFISAIPMDLRVRKNVLQTTEVNFICVHKRLRGKRLAPLLIKEITRLCNLQGIWQAVYTGGVVLPRPVGTCTYFHRALNWQKLYEIGFSPLPANSKPQYQVRKYQVSDHTSTKGLREMELNDVDAVRDLLSRYLARYDLSPEFSREEVEHWLVHKKEGGLGERVVWSYVVEDERKKITDFFSFYCLESSVINTSYQVIRAAYLFYYATDVGLQKPFDKAALKTRLNVLVTDALILGRRFKFDVFNGLSLMDNALFLKDQKFGRGDGQLHYYLFNYMANPIAGGMDERNSPDDKSLSGVGLVML